MAKLYKLTTQDGKTRKGKSNETQWGENVTHEAVGKDAELCTDGVIHAYKHPFLAFIFNSQHANIDNPALWEAEGEIIASDGFKVGVKSLKTTKKLKTPQYTVTQYTAFAILVSLCVHKDPSFIKWANNWLSGKDRTAAAA